MTEKEPTTGPDVFPEEDELPDDPPSIEAAPILDTESENAETVTELAKEDWKESTKARERVRLVVQQTQAGRSVGDIADEADVSETTARNELSTLVDQGIAAVYKTDRGKMYHQNKNYGLFNRVNRLSTRGDLIEQVQSVHKEIQQYREQYGSESPEELLLSDQKMDDEKLTDISYWRTAERKLKFLRAAYRFRDISQDESIEADATNRDRRDVSVDIDDLNQNRSV